MLKVKIGVSGNVFEFEGEASFADILALIEKFFAAISSSNAALQARVDADVTKINEAAATLGKTATTLDGVAPNT